MRFSIVVVCRNAGSRLTGTVQSVLEQSCQDLEIVVKDGGSTDGCLQALRAAFPNEDPERLRIVEEADGGIYEGMNQAIPRCRGKYLLFLNCGDRFYDAEVLRRTAEEMRRQEARMTDKEPLLFYGDIWEAQTGKRVASNPRIDAFACYRNVPCHQCCFYDRRLFAERGYDPAYRVRADYEHFLWCFFVRHAALRYLPFVVAAYEGGGFSETAENRARSRKEHRAVTARYMSAPRRLWYRFLLAATLAPLRTKMAESRRFAGVYNRMKQVVYRAMGKRRDREQERSR